MHWSLLTSKRNKRACGSRIGRLTLLPTRVPELSFLLESLETLSNPISESVLIDKQRSKQVGFGSLECKHWDKWSEKVKTLKINLQKSSFGLNLSHFGVKISDFWNRAQLITSERLQELQRSKYPQSPTKMKRQFCEEKQLLQALHIKLEEGKLKVAARKEMFYKG